MLNSKKNLRILGCAIISLLIGGCAVGNNNSTENSNTSIAQNMDLPFEQRVSDEGIKNFISAPVEKNTVAIFEPNGYHHECMPGYAKYFVDLGYNVEVLIIKGNEDALELFEPKDKIKIYTYESFDGILPATPELSNKFSKYDYVLLESTDPNKKDTFEKLGFFTNSNSLFIMHRTDFIQTMDMQSFEEKNKILTLGEFEEGLYVNPHYFGKVIKKAKNKKTRFFVTSTSGRKYDNLINALSEIKNKNLDFEVIVSGRSAEFGVDSLPENLKSNFEFKYCLSYSEMYKEIQNSDFIIMSLNPENQQDEIFKTKSCTGTAQLVYGFLKPAIVHKDFADFYKFDSKNSLIHQNTDFTECMEKAVRMDNQEYKKIQNNLEQTSNSIYKQSLKNLKKSLNK